MATTVDRGDELVQRVQELTARLDQVADPITHTIADELVAAVVQMYGEGLERIVAALDDAGAPGAAIRSALAMDGVVGSLLLIHDLHPVPVAERVSQALELVRPYMESHGGDVELLGVQDGIAHLRLQGSCRSCRASSATLELAVRQALEEAAPDLRGMEVEGIAEPEPAGVALPMAPAWFDIEGVAALPPDALQAATVAGRPLVVANVAGTLLAYGNACAGCGARLDDGALAGGVLTCRACGRGFALPRAGQAVDDPALQLDPVPLLRDTDGARVALTT